MALDLLLDLATGDLDLTGGRVNFTSDRNTVGRQRLESAIALVRGTWFLDLSEGVDWLGLLRQKRLDAVRRAVTDACLADPDVVAASIQAERSGRTVTVTGTATLGDGSSVAITSAIG